MPQPGTNVESSSSSHPAPRHASGRQVKACDACRITKIKCHMPQGLPPCERCRARGLDCEKTRESTVEDTIRLPETIVGDVSQIKTAVNVLLRIAGLPPLSAYNPNAPESSQEAGSQAQPPEDDCDESLPTAPISTPVRAEEDNSPYTLPVSSLYEVTRLPSLRNPGQQGSPSSTGVHDNTRQSSDFITRGLLPLPAAQELFSRFVTRLDYFCYGITCPHEDLESLRNSSPLLTAAVCTVSALHKPEGSALFKTCHAEFLRLVSGSMFSISYSIDDVRALVIGSWWLGNISYTLLGHAIRIATRLDYHLAYLSVVSHSKLEEDIVKARLWYVLFVMDHHSSILYGRPALLSPMEEQHQQWERFIQETGHCEVDLRVSSQVALYHVLAKVNNIFGVHVAKSIPEHCFPQLQNAFAEVDRWYMVWGNRMPRNAHVGWFPRDGAILSYHFARLHLCLYVFRGMSLEASAFSAPNIGDYASIAVTSASAVLQLVLERDDLRTALVGMPIYYHGMINFAAVFLIKAIRNNFWDLTFMDVSQIFALLQSYLGELKSQDAARQHLVYHLGNGLEEMVKGLSRMPTEGAFPSQGSDETLAQSQTASQAASMFAIDTFNILQGSMPDQEVNATVGNEYQ